MKKHFVLLLSLFSCILIIVGIVYSLTFFQYRDKPNKNPVLETEQSISSWTVLREENVNNYSGFFTIDYLEQYSGAVFILDLKEWDATIKIENRFDWWGESFSLHAGEHYSIFIDERIKKYKNTIGMTIHPTDREKGKISFSYAIIWKE